MWPFTGGCHIDGGCGKYLDWCGDCPVLKSGKKNDLSYKVFKRKVKTYKNIDLTIVGLSNWLKRCAEKSFLFRNKRVVNLPNPINTNFFRPILKSVAKEILNLQANKKLILFGAMGATSDPNKGFKELTEALKKVFPKTLFELIVFGASKPLSIQNFDFPAHYKGRLNDQLSLQILYSAADVVLVPSLQENLSNIIMESLACGTPVVGFNIGGNSDMIDHRVNGYLAEPYDAKDLAKGIDWVVNHKNHQKLCQKAREKVLQKFDSKVVAKQYIALYNEILSKQSHK
jgi:glycosyltransferase involved in cell wall biosynthesis